MLGKTFSRLYLICCLPALHFDFAAPERSRRAVAA